MLGLLRGGPLVRVEYTVSRRPRIRGGRGRAMAVPSTAAEAWGEGARALRTHRARALETSAYRREDRGLLIDTRARVAVRLEGAELLGGGAGDDRTVGADDHVDLRP